MGRPFPLPVSSVHHVYPSSPRSDLSEGIEAFIYIREKGLNMCPASDPSAKNSPWDDVSWILTAAFLIFTMQSGYGLLESGVVSRKNEVNILIKNGANLALGGVCFWMFGYGLSFGTGGWINPIIGWGHDGEFFLDSSAADMGDLYSKYVFQLAYATSSTTIVSGCMAERCKFLAYCVFSFWNTLVYCVPAGWIWGSHGFLQRMGVVDIGGSGTVHLSGAVSGLIGSWFLGPRAGRYDLGIEPLPMGNPTTAVMGLFMLWWGWLGFNAGATFGISGNKWIYASKSTVITMLSSISGGLTVMGFSLIQDRGLYLVDHMIYGVLGSLVAVSAASPLLRTWESLIVGAIGAALALVSANLLDRLKFDDPVRSFSVHGVCGIWGLLVVGLFPDKDNLVGYTRNRAGLFKSGSFELLGLQTLAAVCIIAWSGITSGIILWIIEKTIGLRCSAEEEIVGPDYSDHGIRHDGNADLIEWYEHFKSDEKKPGSLDESDKIFSAFFRRRRRRSINFVM